MNAPTTINITQPKEVYGTSKVWRDNEPSPGLKKNYLRTSWLTHIQHS